MTAERQQAPVFRRRFPAEERSVGLMRRAVRRFAKSIGAARELEDRMMLAVSEAATNGLVHAERAAEPGWLSLAAWAPQDGVVEIAIADDGPGFRPRAGTPGLGLGLPIIATVSDGLRVERGGGGRGAVVRIRFRLG